MGKELSREEIYKEDETKIFQTKVMRRLSEIYYEILKLQEDVKRIQEEKRIKREEKNIKNSQRYIEDVRMRQTNYAEYIENRMKNFGERW